MKVNFEPIIRGLKSEIFKCKIRFIYKYLLSSMLRRVAPVADMYVRLFTLALCFYHHYSCFPQKQ